MTSVLIELGWPAKQLSPNARRWTDNEIAIVREAYERAKVGEDIGLDALADRLGRLKSNICRKARQLGLTDIGRPLKLERKDRRKYGNRAAFLEHASKLAKERIAKHGHNRGMLGKKHTAETRRIIGEKSAAYWAALTEEQCDAQRARMVRGACESGPPKVARGSWKAGWREIGGKRNYYRSRWEANYARWLQILKDRGEITDWEYEPKTFWFDDIKRGARSYKPDFRVSGGIAPDYVTWHEVKGWMDSRSFTVLRRFAKYHPDEVLILIDSKRYGSLDKWAKHAIGGWE
jgi:hypothetical protein